MGSRSERGGAVGPRRSEYCLKICCIVAFGVDFLIWTEGSSVFGTCHKNFDIVKNSWILPDSDSVVTLWNTLGWYICESKYHYELKFSARNFSSFFKLKFSTRNFWAEIPSWNFLSRNFQLGKWAEIPSWNIFESKFSAWKRSWNSELKFWRVKNWESKISITFTKVSQLKSNNLLWISKNVPSSWVFLRKNRWFFWSE